MGETMPKIQEIKPLCRPVQNSIRPPKPARCTCHWGPLWEQKWWRRLCSRHRRIRGGPHTQAKKPYSARIFAHMLLNAIPVKFQLGCRATVNLPANVYKASITNLQCKGLDKTSTTLVMFNKTELLAIGKLTTLTVNPKNQYHLDYTVVGDSYKPLLGARAIQQPRLMSVNQENVMSLDSGSPTDAGYCIWGRASSTVCLWTQG